MGRDPLSSGGGQISKNGRLRRFMVWEGSEGLWACRVVELN